MYIYTINQSTTRMSIRKDQYSHGKIHSFITRTGTNDNLPAISVKDDQGKLIEFQPSSFYLRDDGKISVQGFKKNALNKLDAAWVSYDANKDVFKSQALGYDIEEEFKKLNNSTPAASTGSTYTGIPTGGF